MKISITGALNEWYQTALGASLLKSELAHLEEVLSQVFGYYIIQIGGPTYNNEVLAISRINNQIIINAKTNTLNNALTVECKLNALPFIPDSIDAVVAFHTLEFMKNPQEVLKEIYTALVPNGQLVILGFNPYSLWGISNKTSKKIPWNRKWISPGHKRNFLNDTGFSTDDYKTFYFRPPDKNLKKFLFLEGIGQIFWPYCGASYIITARKNITGLTPTPIKPRTSIIKQLRAMKAVPKPTSRITCDKNQT